MAANHAEQIAALQTSDAQTRREIAAIKIRLDTVAENAKAENENLHAKYLTELADLRADMSRLFDDLGGRVADLRVDMERRFTELHVETEKRFGEAEKRFGEMRADMDKRLGDLRADMEKRFGELRAGMEKRFGEVGQRLGELRAEMEKHAKESVERENRMLRAINAQTKWMIATAFTVVGLVFVMLRYVGPATGAG